MSCINNESIIFKLATNFSNVYRKIIVFLVRKLELIFCNYNPFARIILALFFYYNFFFGVKMEMKKSQNAPYLSSLMGTGKKFKCKYLRHEE